MFRSRRRIGYLDEKSDDVVLERGKSTPAASALKHLSARLKVGAIGYRDRKAATIRDVDEVAQWANSFARDELEILQSEFSNDEKDFEVLLVRSRDECELNLIFQLSTVGHSGWTQYRIAWRRISEREFACVY